MADEKLTDLTAITSADDNDLLYVVDVSDTTDDAAGSSKGLTVDNLRSSLYNITDNSVSEWVSVNSSQNVTFAANVSLGNTFFLNWGASVKIVGDGSAETMELQTNNIAALSIDSSQNITVAGTVDGRDIAADGTTLDALPSITVGTTAPGSPATGDLWVDTN